MDSNATNDDPIVINAPADGDTTSRQVNGEGQPLAYAETNGNNITTGNVDHDNIVKANEVTDEPREFDHQSTRSKRSAKPSAKSIENRIQADNDKLEKLWSRISNSITMLRETPDSLEELRAALTKVRAIFHEYQVSYLSYIDFLTRVDTADCQKNRKICEEVMRNHERFVESNIAQANDRKKDLQQELGSLRPSSAASSSSSSAVRLKARAEAAAAIKRAEMQKRRSAAESQSALKIQEEELALAQRKMEEQARIESLRLEEEAAIAVAKANAIEDELNFMTNEEPLQLNIPVEDTSSKMQRYFEGQRENQDDDHSNPPSPTTQRPQPDQRLHPLNPTAVPYNPLRQEDNTMKSYLDFLARQELVANKVQKFDDRPESYHTWKESFKSMICNVTLTPSEELTLIIENTTNNSRKLAQQLRNAYIRNPARGVIEVWQKLGERYGSDIVLTKAYLDKLKDFPKIGFRENKRLQEFGDLLLELECAKEDGGLQGLRVLDEPIYLQPVICKLPGDVQGRWQRHAFQYKKDRRIDYPPFTEFSRFIQDVSREKNDPNLVMGDTDKDNVPSRNPNVKVRRTYKTEVDSEEPKSEHDDLSNWCILHRKRHPLSKCRAFRNKPLEERKALLKRHSVCFRCLASSSHMAKDCKCTIKCTECGSERHLSAFHAGSPPQLETSDKGEQGGEPEDNSHAVGSTDQQRVNERNQVTARCTEVCGKGLTGKSCSKICLANVYAENAPETKFKTYVVIDEQSNCSLGKPELFDKLNLVSEPFTYTLKTCAGSTQTEGRRAKGLVIESLDESKQFRLPALIECDAIPDSKDEISTPAVAKAYPHLRPIAEKIPELERDADILLLVGRDVPQLHKVHESRNGRGNSPWAQRLNLGWVLLGNVCLDGAHKPRDVSSFKTHILPSGRPSILEPCPNTFQVIHHTDHVSGSQQPLNDGRKELAEGKFVDGLGANVFVRTQADDRPGSSVEDRKFVSLMEETMKKNDTGNWTAPLPFRHEVTQLPNSREAAYKRLRSTLKTLEKKPLMKQHYFESMQKTLDNGHAEPVPKEDLASAKPCWYLPHFGVYHPQKPEKIRVVFDSAAECDGVSLNKLLLSGPNSTNSLLGVLLRFRQNPVGFIADIEQMFHSFMVREDHRNFLRFLWHEDNNRDGRIVEYRMKVHLFGNTSSPAVATFGLRKTAQVEEERFGSDAKKFVYEDFYVDDGLKSTGTSQQAIDLLRRTRAMLTTANLRLHKIASNDTKVANAFPDEDRALVPCDLNFDQGVSPIQRSLGVCWDLKTDTFTFRVAPENKPFTRRGVLAVTNGIYDPLGIAAPVVIRGKMLLRSMSSDLKNHQRESWDTPLPPEHKPAWEQWCQSLSNLRSLKIPRAYASTPLEEARRVELHTFCDASVQGIAAVSYLKITESDGHVKVSFVMGKAKLTPPHATTIPRLELCAAVLGVEITELILEERVTNPDSIMFYSDSKVVLGYISNETRRFYVYVGNRVERIRKSSTPEQWQYVPTDENPADAATRSIDSGDLMASSWLTGPTLLHSDDHPEVESSISHEPLPDDPEIRPTVQTLSTSVQTTKLGSNRFERFSRWLTLVKAISKLIMVVRLRRRQTTRIDAIQTNQNVYISGTPDITITPVQARKQAEVVIISAIQHEMFSKVFECIQKKTKLQKDSPLLKLSPIIDADGLLRVGGRLDRSDQPYEERHPLILPGNHYTTSLIVTHCHEEVEHQGRHFTHGRVRARGFWIVGGKRSVNRVIHHCFKCRKLRGRLQHQKMADLPTQRITPSAPFTNVGLDVFGPWEVAARRTRGGLACNKRWAVIFTCLSSRAIHIELVETMGASSFINALRRFVAIRGPVEQIFSDCGTNFTGAHNELKSALKEMDPKIVESYLTSEGCQWSFNSPHASHAGGVWERMIGICRRILDSILADLRPNRLTHEVLSTLMAEVAAIVNSRPLVAVSSDPSAPLILTPSVLLTQKTLPLRPTPGKFVPQDMFTKQWRQVQYLANKFWFRWKKEFLPTLQPRRKWEDAQPNIKVGDLVLLRCKESARNHWPLARVSKTLESADGRVRKVEVTTAKNDARQTYTRPVTELVLLKTEEELNL